MSDGSPLGALEGVGWSPRVAALVGAADRADARPARVVRVDRGAVTVVDSDGPRALAVPGGLSVGDWVLVDSERVLERLDRWSELGRGDPDHGRQVLAANVDVAFVVAPADRLSPARIERELVLAWDSGARPVVLLTKADLADDDPLPGLEERLSGVDVLATSAVTGEGLARVRQVLDTGTTAVLLGPSGAGKSTLLNALVPGATLATGDVRDEDRRGRHTTTWRELLPVPSGGCVIDMPGLRSLGLDVDDAAVAIAFADIEELARGCRFDDCRHETEPGCAVHDAVDRGELDASRYASWRKLQRELYHERRRVDPVAHKAEVDRWKVIHKAHRRNPKRPR